MIRTRRWMLAALAVLAIPGAALAQPPHAGGGPGRGGGQGQGGGPPGRGGGNGQGGGPPGRGAGQGQGGGPPGRGGPVAITPLGPSYRPRIQGWYAGTPGFTARPLPPGIARQLARGRPLPPGIARQAAPPGLLGMLPIYPGHSWLVIGTAIVLVDAATGIVRDLVLDALLR